MDNIEQEIARCCGTVADKERMQKLVKELTDQLADTTRQCGVMAESLCEAISVLSSINHGGEHEVHIDGDEPAFWQRGEWVDWAKSEVLPKLKSALAGKLPNHTEQPLAMVPECWQPIETAPKDGKRALLLARFSAAGNLAELDWDGEWGSYRDGPNDDLHWDWLSYGGIDNPTHWIYQPIAAAQKPEADNPGHSLAMARVRKTGGSFQHTGTVLAEFRTLAGEQRIALEFDAPVAGMLHIYRPDQVEPLEGGV